MTVEELVAKLSFRASGANEARKFISDLQKVRKELAKLKSDSRGGANFGFGGGAGAGRLARDLERATAAARRYRQEIARIGRTGGGGRFTPGSLPGAPGYPTRPISERIRERRSGVTGGVVAGNIITDTVRGVARLVAKPLVTFANEETAAKSLKLTADVSDERVAGDMEKFRAQAADLGESPKKMLEVANAFVAAGLKYEDAIAATVPTIKTAKAGRASVDDVAQAGIAAMNNLGISSADIKKAYDIMLASGKAGQVEVKDLAHVLPELAASAQKAGYSGLGGLTDVTSQLQFARKSTSSASEAANNQKNFYDKIFAEVTTKAFKGIDVDLEKKITEGAKKGLNAAQVTFNEIEKYTKGNPFRAKELFGDVQAGDFVTAYLKYKKEIGELGKEVDRTAPGSVDRDFGEVMTTLRGKADALGAAFERLMGQVGEYGSSPAKKGAEIAAAGVDGAAGRKSSDAETAAFVNRLNARFGLPPGYKTISGAEFDERYGEGTSAPPMSLLSSDFRARIQGRGKRKTIAAPAPSYAGATNPTFGSPTQRMDWMKQNVQQAASNTTSVSNSVSVSANGVGLKELADMIAAKVKEAMAGFATKSDLRSMGASIAKGNTTPTSPTLTGP